jgi:hypothetical protein
VLVQLTMVTLAMQPSRPYTRIRCNYLFHIAG